MLPDDEPNTELTVWVGRDYITEQIFVYSSLAKGLEAGWQENELRATVIDAD